MPHVADHGMPPSLFALALIERGPMLAWVVQVEPDKADDIGKILYANRAFASALGRGLKEVLGQYWWALAPSEQQQDLREMIERHSVIGHWPREFVQPFQQLDGRIGFIQCRLMADEMLVNPDGQPRYLLVLGELADVQPADFHLAAQRDRDLRRSSQELKSANAAITALLNTLDGLLRSYVAGTVGLARGLEKRLGPRGAPPQPVDDSVRDMAQHLLRASEAAGRLLEEMIFHKEIQTGHRKFNPVLVDLEDLLNDAVQREQALCEAKQQTISITAPDETVTFRADPQAMLLVLGHLLSNARKFTPRGGKIRVEGKADGDAVSIRVIDSGTGILPQRIPTLFDVSSPKTSPGTEAETGTGFGLAICHGIVEAHGGVILVQSEVGDGSTFTVRLPKSAS